MKSQQQSGLVGETKGPISFAFHSGDMLYSTRDGPITKPPRSTSRSKGTINYYDAFCGNRLPNTALRSRRIVYRGEVGDNHWGHGCENGSHAQATIDEGAYVHAVENLREEICCSWGSMDPFAHLSPRARVLQSMYCIGRSIPMASWRIATLSTGDDQIDHIVVVLGHAPIAVQDSVAVGASSGLWNDSDESGRVVANCWIDTYGVNLYVFASLVKVHAISMQLIGQPCSSSCLSLEETLATIPKSRPERNPLRH